MSPPTGDVDSVVVMLPGHGGSALTASGIVCAALVLSVLVASCAADPEVAKRTHLERGDMYVAAHKYKEAILEYRNALQQDPRFGEARLRLAEAYAIDGNAAAAAREYVRAADAMPGNAAAQIKAGQILLQAQRFEEAQARAVHVLAAEPGNVPALLLRGTALTGLKDLDSAIVQIEEAIALDPEGSGSYANLGAVRLAKGDPKAAEDAFTKAVQLDGASVPARLTLAVFYLATGRSAEAEDALRRTLEIDPVNVTANRALALIYLSSGRAKEAEPHLKAVADASRAAAGQLALADYYTLTNRPADAVRILTTVGPDDAQAFTAAQTRLAAIEYAGKQTIPAHQRLDSVLSRQPRYANALLLKGRFLLIERQFDRALELGRAAAAADVKSAQTQFFLGKVYAAVGQLDEAATAFNDVLKLNPMAASAHVALSRVQLANGQVDASIESARQALKSLSDNPGVRMLLASGLIARRELGLAERELTALVARYPNLSLVHTQIGLLNLTKGDGPAAQRAFDRALTLDPHSPDALSGLVRLDLGAGKTADARARIDARLTAAPNDPALLLLAASTFAASGDPSRAEQALRRAIELNPADVEAHAMLGELFLSQRNLEAARVAFETLTERRPRANETRSARTMVALILEAQNRPAEAQRHYEQILADDPRNVVAANNLAWHYAEHGGSLDKALALAQTAVQHAPDDPTANDTLGWIYYKKDLLGHAIAALERSVARDAANPEYHYHLGLAYAKNGDRAKARRSLETALRLQPDFQGAAEARKVLASIPG